MLYIDIISIKWKLNNFDKYLMFFQKHLMNHQSIYNIKSSKELSSFIKSISKNIIIVGITSLRCLINRSSKISPLMSSPSCIKFFINIIFFIRSKHGKCLCLNISNLVLIIMGLIILQNTNFLMTNW